MNKKTLIGSIIAICILVGVSFTSVVGKDLELDENVYLQPNKELTRKHLKYLFRGLILSDNYGINKILIKIIFRIIRDGNVSIDEMQRIIESSNVDIEEIYILAEVKTTEWTDGNVACLPGWLRTYIGYNAKGATVAYDDYGYMNKVLYGWNLHVDGELISKNEGCIFGYSGYVCNGFHGEYSYFNLDGFGILILNGI